MSLCDELNIMVEKVASDENISEKYKTRIQEGKLTRDENSASHVCIYFLPYNVDSRKVFIVAHKKSGLWLSPGGHIDKDELVIESVERELKEELGIVYSLPKDALPQILTITPIGQGTRACKIHFDLWFFIPTNGRNFSVDMNEFHETRWTHLEEACSLITEKNNLKALAFINNNLF